MRPPDLRLAAIPWLRYSFSGGPLCKLLPYACSVIYRKSGALVKDIAPSAKDSIMCAFAWTVSTTAQIAAKRAMSL
jgi:hypothetical protein